MSKIHIKLDKQFLTELTGSLDKSALEGNNKLLSLFDMININRQDNKIDVKEIADFVNSIFVQADENNDDEIDKSELENFVKTNRSKFANLKIKAKDILEFFDIFRNQADKSDEKSQRITNPDGSYSIIYEDLKKTDKKDFKETDKNKPQKKEEMSDKVLIKKNFDSNGRLISTETTQGLYTTITDANGKFLAEQKKQDGKVVSERKNDGLTYYYEDNKTTVKLGGTIVSEIITLDNGQTIRKEYDTSWGKTIITTTNETTGEVSHETVYSDKYEFNVRPHCMTSLAEMKALINDELSSDTMRTFLWNGENVIDVISKEDDANFKKTLITGMVNKTIEIAEILGVKSDELKAIQKEIDENGFESVSTDKINDAYATVFKRIEVLEPDISESQIDNKYYHSDKVYTKIFTNSKITIIDKETNQTTNIDLSKMLKPFNSEDREKILDALKDISAEALLDFAAEVTFANGSIAQGEDGYFNYLRDIIVLQGGSCSAETLLHELGHAVDCKGKGSENKFQTMHNAKFRKAFNEEMKAFIKAGNKRCTSYFDRNGTYQVKDSTFLAAESVNDSAYATVDAQEMFAECYALLMLGSVSSEEVIAKYFPNTLQCVKEIVESTRTLSKQQRHV